MAVKHSSLRPPRGSDTRYLQNNKDDNKDNNKNDNKDTPAPTRLPTPPPTEAPAVPTIPTLSPTQSPFAVIKPSFLSFEGSVELTWSQHLTVENEQFSTDMMAEMTEWIGQEFLCEQQDSILLTSTLALQSDCVSASIEDGNSTLVDQTKTVIWNAPTASVELLEESGIEYTLWSVRYPVYDEFYNGLQQDLQSELNIQIIDEDIATPSEGAILSIVGNEVDFFSFNVTVPVEDGDEDTKDDDNMNNSNGTESPTVTSYPTSSFTPAPTSILSPSSLNRAAPLVDSTPAKVVQGLGGITAILHTILLIGLHVFGKSYLKKEMRKKRETKGANPGLKPATPKRGRSSKKSVSSSTSSSRREDCVEFENEGHQLEEENEGQDVGLELLLMATKKGRINRRDSSKKNPSPNRTEYFVRSRTPSPQNA